MRTSIILHSSAGWLWYQRNNRANGSTWWYLCPVPVGAASLYDREGKLELIIFIFLSVGACLTLAVRRRAAVYSWFCVFVTYSLVVRLAPPTLDMVAYTSAIIGWPPTFNLYTLREPIIWLGAPLLYRVIRIEVLIFLAFDIASGLIVIRAMAGLDKGDGRMLSLAPTILVSYVFLMGQQNAWRQQVGFVLVLWSCAARTQHQRRAIALFILSVLAHNSTALLAGYWYDVGRTGGKRCGPLITIIGVVLIASLFPYLGKSSSVTGLRTEYLYVIVAVALSLLVLLANSGRFPLGAMDGMLNFAAFVPAIAVLGSTQFERMGMMFLVLILIDMIRHQGPLHLRGIEVRSLAFVVLVVPVFLFPNALNMLLT